jgi:hypothetical protein
VRDARAGDGQEQKSFAEHGDPLRIHSVRKRWRRQMDRDREADRLHGETRSITIDVHKTEVPVSESPGSDKRNLGYTL